MRFEGLRGTIDAWGRHLDVWRAAWRAERGAEKPAGRERATLDFLPAALEIQDRPPHPAARVTVFVLILFFVVAVLWASIGEVDVVAVAQGKIVPSERVKVIQPLEIGTVRTILVEEGQSVHAGDVLVELDPTATLADESRLAAELQASRFEHARLRALLAAVSSEPPAREAELQVGFDAAEEDALRQRNLLVQQLGEFTARVLALDSDSAKKRAELAATAQQIQKLTQTLPLVTKRATALKSLTSRQLAAESSYLELEQARIEQENDLAYYKHRRAELEAAVAEAEANRSAMVAEFRANAATALMEAENRIAGLEQELIKARKRNSLQRLTAPVDGVVQQLAVHTIGGVVTPAQELMRIVPRDAPLEVQAWLPNKDIGFVHEGQVAEVKVETFPFTKYGVIDAEILDVSNDAVADEKLGLVYASRVLMKKAAMQIGERVVNLTPGMAVTVEVKTGKRRLIEFFLSPLLRYRDEGLRER